MNSLRNDLNICDLKICEGCGVLWLRAGGSPAGLAPAPRAGVYCKSCTRLFAAFPAARAPKKNSRIRIRTPQPQTPQPQLPAEILAGGAR